jgi:hypothetical protein
MRSRTARLIFSALVLIAIGASAFFIIQSEKEISQRRAALRAFDLHAREATVALADLRAGQQAYVAAGQGVAFWMPKVATIAGTAVAIVNDLMASAPSAEAHESLTEAAATIAAFEDVDRRAREYLRSGQQLMAGDVVFTEGGETAAEAARQVESARLAEHQAVDASEASLRRRQAIALVAAAGASAILAILLVLVPTGQASAQSDSDTISSESNTADGELALNDFRLNVAHAAGQPKRPSVPALKTAAELCTELGRVNDIDELKKLLARAATALDAGGLIIWIGNAAGADLRPVLAHGYASQAIARMPAVPRSADNAAAKAYRTGALQIVLARPGTSNGAVVAPLLSPEGCIGALTAEINDRGETSDTVQALAAIFAAQLAGVLAPSVTSSADALPGQVAI